MFGQAIGGLRSGTERSDFYFSLLKIACKIWKIVFNFLYVVKQINAITKVRLQHESQFEY